MFLKVIINKIVDISKVLRMNGVIVLGIWWIQSFSDQWVITVSHILWVSCVIFENTQHFDSKNIKKLILELMLKFFQFFAPIFSFQERNSFQLETLKKPYFYFPKTVL